MGKPKTYKRRMFDFGYEATLAVIATGCYSGYMQNPGFWWVYWPVMALAVYRFLGSVSPVKTVPSVNLAQAVSGLSQHHHPEFIFQGRGLRGAITETRLRQFCEIGCRRQRHFYHSQIRAYWGKPGHSVQMTETQILSANYFYTQTTPRFNENDLWDCKETLRLTHQILKWGTGHGGVLIHENPGRLVQTAVRNFYPPTLMSHVVNLVGLRPTSRGSKRLPQVATG